ncbi:MAG: sulfotransferase family 2 domain-containing protein [Flavobacteriales bacterium]|nr:sulfotransferase family 2 domain-containing protein [Flavobacteriales bacterium]
MNENTIFIHVPKTGGTTINTAVNDTEWQTNVGFHYRHIRRETKTSNTAEMFDPTNFDKFSKYAIFMMLREPVDRLISEYYFLKERKEYVKLLGNTPASFKEFVDNPQTSNYMVGFLVGNKLYDKKLATEDDLNRVLLAIDKLPIHVGIFEQFAESLAYFSEKIKLDWKENIEAKRMTFQRPKKDEIGQEIVEKIVKNNQLDQRLYDYCLIKFNAEKPKKIKKKVNFELSKYNHIVPYSKTFILYEFCTTNKNYLKQNNLFFRKLNTFLHGRLKITDGTEFAATWNASYEEAVDRTFTGTDFANVIYKALNSDQDHLQVTINIGNAIDTFFEINGKSADKFYRALDFDVSMVKRIRPQQELPKEKSGFFAKLFSK